MTHPNPEPGAAGAIDGIGIVGADLLEILTTAMYTEPMVIYRELLQNSADAIDAAIASDLLAPGGGLVEIRTDLTGTRSVTIRDNGIGVPNADFASRMLRFGASEKRATGERGFRGIGRLAALGYCRELVFRSRSLGDTRIVEAIWDGAKARTLWSNPQTRHLSEALATVVEISSRPATDQDPPHYFEVELRHAMRQAFADLADARSIVPYLQEVAPVPFHPDFTFGPLIRERILASTPLLELDVRVDGRPVYKAYRDTIEVRRAVFSHIRSIEFVDITSYLTGSSPSAIGWIAHHDYLGAIPSSTRLSGIRARVGNVSVGNNRLLERSFPEERFSAWSLGEVHIFNPLYRPNARRDAFSDHAQRSLEDGLFVAARGIASKIRTQSLARNTGKNTHRLLNSYEACATALAPLQGPVTDAVRDILVSDLHNRLTTEQSSRAESAATAATFDLPRSSATPTLAEQGEIALVERLARAGRSDLIQAIIPYLSTTRL